MSSTLIAYLSNGTLAYNATRTIKQPNRSITFDSRVQVPNFTDMLARRAESRISARVWPPTNS